MVKFQLLPFLQDTLLEIRVHWLLSVVSVLSGKLPRLPGNLSCHQLKLRIGGHVSPTLSRAEATWRPR